MSNLAVFPFFMALTTALITLVWRMPTRGRRAFVLGSQITQLLFALFLCRFIAEKGMLVLVVGGWSAPYGIALTVDLLSAIMIVLTGITTLAAMAYGFFQQEPRFEHPLRVPLIQFMVAGINLAFSTGDLFNLFVAFEIMLIASYSLMTLEAENPGVRHAYPYLSINLFGSTLFLAACGLCYSLFGSLNFATIALAADSLVADPRFNALVLMLMVVFGIKAAIFPLFYWLQDSYPVMPAPLVALYSGMLTKVGIYAYLRLFGTLLPHQMDGMYTLLCWLAVPTMLVGVVGAISKIRIRGILSFHIVSQIGFMLLALGLFTPYAVTACIFYIMHHILVKSSLFLIGGVASTLNGSDDLRQMGNLWKTAPWLGVLFLIQALSLAGLPPLSGFWGKYMIVTEALAQGRWVLVAAAILASLLTLFSMLKIWMGAFWPVRSDVPVAVENKGWRAMTWVVASVAVLSLSIGFGAQWFLGVAEQASRSLLDRPAYIEKVLQVRGKGS